MIQKIILVIEYLSAGKGSVESQMHTTCPISVSPVGPPPPSYLDFWKDMALTIFNFFEVLYTCEFLTSHTVFYLVDMVKYSQILV